MANTRIRIRFTKTGDLRWIGHMDLARLWERLVRKAGLAIALTEGFHPKPKISFPSALALGIEGLDEAVELELTDAIDLTNLERQLQPHLLPGLQILNLEQLTPETSRQQLRASTFEIEIPDHEVAALQTRLDAFVAAPTWTVVRENRTLSVSVGDPDFDVRLIGTVLRFTLPNSGGASFRPGELLHALSLEHLQEQGVILRRTRVHLGKSLDPKPSNSQQTETPAPSHLSSSVLIDGD
jgi:radical SAM-linked protein